jgi:hypothetical protein
MDKKLKNAADKITMPSDMKERIINACENAERNRSNTDNNDGYIDVVSSSERVNPRSRIIRTISAVAACAVLVSGIGATGVFLHRQHGSHMSGSEASECRSCPFGDFTTFDYSFDAGDGMYGNYSIETYAKLSDFLNKFNWGSELEEYETRTPDQDIEGQIYNIKWTKGDTPPIECNIHIANDGFVTYQESMMDFETGAQKTITENSRCYKIDFDAFDSGIMEILSKADEAPTPFGDFTTFDYTLNANDGKYNDLSDDKRAKLSDFLNKFDWGEEISTDELTEEEKRESEVKLHYLEWRIDDKVYGLAVNDLGLAVYNVSKVNKVEGNREEIKQESVKLYRVDYEAFDRGFTDILEGKVSAPTPFGDFKTFDFAFSKDTKYYSMNSGEVYEEIADFLNNFDWGEEQTEPAQQQGGEVVYNVDWEIGDSFYYFYILKDGQVSYGEGNKDNGSGAEAITDNRYYKIDFDAFDSGITEILDKYQEKTSKGVYVVKNGKGTLESVKLFDMDNVEVILEDEAGREKLEEFLKDDFSNMLKPTVSDDIVGGIKWTVERIYRIDKDTQRRETYFIYMDGFVNRCEYQITGNVETPTGTDNHEIDMKELGSVLEDDIGIGLAGFAEININKVD